MLDFEKIEDYSTGNDYGTYSTCNCVCQGSNPDKPLSTGTANFSQGSKQIGSCIS